ncbi:MAG: cytochrome b5 domain-containing protein [Oscillospiraceae bacterium]
MKRSALLITAALSALLVLSGCGGTASETPSSSPAASSLSSTAAASGAEERIFTLEELAAYNGKDGQPAYVAVDGVVYDVSASPEWENGEHKMGITAGQDLTEEIKNKSPHGVSVLSGFPVVGRLAE